MKGHLLERSPGHWAIVLDVKDPSTGKRRRKWHSFRGGKREAQKRLAELITELQQGAYVEPNKQTVAAYFTTWLRDWAPMKAGPKTLERYESLAKHIIAAIGSKPLQHVRGSDLARIYRDLGAKGLSPKTVKHVHVLARGTFRQAVRLGDLKENRVLKTTPPPGPPRQLRSPR